MHITEDIFINCLSTDPEKQEQWTKDKDLYKRFTVGLAHALMEAEHFHLCSP